MDNSEFLSPIYLEKLENKYARMLKDDPMSDCCVQFAKLLITRKKLDKALEVLTREIRQNKHSVTARHLLGKIYLERWMIDKAREEFKIAVRLAPANIDASRELINIYSIQKNFDAALDIARNLCLCHPGNREIRAVFERLNMFVSIDEDKPPNFRSVFYRTEIRDDEREDFATETLANLYFEQGHHTRAAKILDKLLKKDPFNMKLLNKRQKIKTI